MATNRKATKVADAPVKSVRKQITIPPIPSTQALIAGQKPGEQEPTESGVTVDVHIPKQVTLTLDNHTSVTYQPGTDTIPEEHARHWWARANGVKVIGEEDED